MNRTATQQHERGEPDSLVDGDDAHGEQRGRELGGDDRDEHGLEARPQRHPVEQREHTHAHDEVQDVREQERREHQQQVGRCRTGRGRRPSRPSRSPARRRRRERRVGREVVEEQQPVLAPQPDRVHRDRRDRDGRRRRGTQQHHREHEADMGAGDPHPAGMDVDDVGGDRDAEQEKHERPGLPVGGARGEGADDERQDEYDDMRRLQKPPTSLHAGFSSAFAGCFEEPGTTTGRPRGAPSPTTVSFPKRSVTPSHSGPSVSRRCLAGGTHPR